MAGTISLRDGHVFVDGKHGCSRCMYSRATHRYTFPKTKYSKKEHKNYLCIRCVDKIIEESNGKVKYGDFDKI